MDELDGIEAARISHASSSGEVVVLSLYSSYETEAGPPGYDARHQDEQPERLLATSPAC